MPLTALQLATANNLLAFLEKSPSPFHCVAESLQRLEDDGFVILREEDDWHCEPGKGYVVTRGGASLIAWRMGETEGFHIVGAHTDSPNLRLKPRVGRQKQGYLQAEVDVYGGVLLSTWLDRDLGIAGRVVTEQNGSLQSHLLNIDKPLCRVSNLAIHLNREVNEKGLLLNKHQHLAPIFALGDNDVDASKVLLSLLAETAQVSAESILGHELCLYDLQAPTLSGLHDEFIHSARLDNQAMCHAALSALLKSSTSPEQTAMIALFDHEEVGSMSNRGADGSFLLDVLTRLSGSSTQTARAIAKSMMISADMAHAVHPNYSDMHDASHMPRLNAGPVLKTNYNQRYATDAESGALFRSLCQKSHVSYQEFVNRPDLACGSTIGPISAARIGLRTVDVGNPMLSMHSIRELAGTADHAAMIAVMTTFFG